MSMPIPHMIRPRSPILMVIVIVIPKPNPSVYEQAQYTDVILLIGLQYQRSKLFLSSKSIPFGFINANLAVAFAFYFDVINAYPASGMPIEHLFLRVYFDQYRPCLISHSFQSSCFVGLQCCGQDISLIFHLCAASGCKCRLWGCYCSNKVCFRSE